MWRAGKRFLQSRLALLCALALLLAAGTLSLSAQETESLNEPPQEVTSLSFNKPSETPELDALFQSLRDEINNWGMDSETLQNWLQGFLTINGERLPYWTLLKEQFEGLSEGEKQLVLSLLSSNILETERADKAERSVGIWKGLGISGLAVGVVSVLIAIFK